MTRSPDLGHAIAGWRTWSVRGGPGGPRLHAPVTGTVWLPEEARSAWCQYGRHDAPATACRCGLYAVADLSRLTREIRRGPVVGCTALWGRVVEHETGWRGEFGYPLVLFSEPSVTERTRLRLVDRYGVAVHPLPDTLESLVVARRVELDELARRVRVEAARSGLTQDTSRLDGAVVSMLRGVGAAPAVISEAAVLRRAAAHGG